MENAVNCPPLTDLLAGLGLSVSDLEESALGNAYRIEFEDNFTVELEPLSEYAFKASTRICLLGKSLEVQNKQIEKAMTLMEEVMALGTPFETLAISQEDNCLRLLVELFQAPTATDPKKAQERLAKEFEEFASNAYAFRKTYFHYGQQD